jgi:hypothetical protein
MIFLLPFLVATAALAADDGYLFATFKGEQTPMTEQVYFVASPDGRAWHELNGGKPVLVSGLGEKGVRDPFLLRSHDGSKFYLLATDLSINLNRNWGRAVTAGSRAIVIWESDDLVKWSEPRLVPVAAADAGCTWAPEAIYDEKAGDYLVFWASKTAADKFAKHRIWAARTKDFVTFGAPFVYIDKPNDVIDTTIVRENGRYYRYSKDEKTKGVIAETGDALDGPWQDIANSSLTSLSGYEGPACFITRPATADRPATWCLLLDHYSRGEGYKPFTAEGLAGGQFKPAADIKFPFRLRHGSVLPVSAEEYARLQAAYK